MKNMRRWLMLNLSKKSDSQNLEIAAGIILCGGKVLLGQRRHDKSLPFLWEFPGGKLEKGETLEQCLKRELMEEMGLELEVKQSFMSICHTYDFGVVHLHAFIATCATPEIGLLTAHESYAWVKPSEIMNYALTKADVPIAEAFIKACAQNKSLF